MSGVVTVGSRRYEIRSDLTYADLVEIEAVQREVWGPDDIVPSSQLRAVEHAGGLVAAAFEGERMIGFSYGFLARPHGRGMSGEGLHSHMVAVRSEGRGLGVGQGLKWNQRRWALANGLEWISWTFDPLQARNARLNLEHLGALAFDYLVDFYGPMSGPLGGGQSSDRLLAVWQLDSERVRRLEPGHGAGRQDDDAPGAAGYWSEEAPEPWAVTPNTPGLDAEPLIAAVPDDAETVRVAVPKDVTNLLTVDPDLARRWRGAVGVTMSRLLDGGYTVSGFRDGGYVLVREHSE
jgi:predicted GNAT superfamily acetyltransferase